MIPRMRQHVSAIATVLVLGLAFVSSGCSSKSDSATGAGAGGAGAGPARAIMGTPLATRVIEDPQQKMPAGVVAVPATWKFQSQITWNYAHYEAPVAATMSAENPENDEGIYSHPYQMFFDLRPRGYFRPGENYGGYIYAVPVSPVDALARFIRQLRGKSPDFAFAGSKNLPGLAKALALPDGPNVHGIGIKVTYTLNGKPVEEEFYAVGYRVELPYDGPQGRTYQINWGLLAPHSFRAAAGTLEKRRPIFTAMAKSFRPNPEWQARVDGIKQYLAAEFNRQLQAGYDRIAAAVAMSRAISANNDAMIASLQSQRAAANTRASSSGGSGGSSSFSDYLRGVETVSDPYYGTSQQSNNQSFHWTDGYGTYRSSNDVTYDPNRSEVGNWTLMKGVR